MSTAAHHPRGRRPDSVAVRPATRQDCEAICRVHVGAIRAQGPSAYTAEQFESWAGRLEPALYAGVVDDGRVFVAVRRRTVRGFGQFNVRSGEVEAIYVDPAALGRGIGRRLLEEAHRRARSAGLVVVRVTASINAVGFYERCGYEAIGEVTHQTSGGHHLPCRVLQRRL
jgi:putative acetyltransferase